MTNDNPDARIPFPHLSDRSDADGLVIAPWSRQRPSPQRVGGVSAWLAPWQAAECDTDVQAILLQAVEAQASLGARLRHDARVAGAGQRLALEEVGDAMWLAGDAAARDRLAFYAADRQAAADPGDQRALWAVRRLLGDADPSALTVSELREFLGLYRAEDDEVLDEGLDEGLLVDLFPRAQGDELDSALSDWLQAAAALADAHRLVRATILFRAWRWLGLSGPEEVVTPMVIASRIAAGQGSFVPFAGAARRLRLLATPGTEVDKMVAMLRAFGEGARQAGLLLERSVIWRDRAARLATTKAERAVVDAVAQHPVIGSNAIAAASGLTPQAINTAARALRAQGVIGEATGNSRFRLWQAKA